MRFWDSSAVVSLLVTEAATAQLLRTYEADPEMVVWWATEIECACALARRSRERGGRLGASLERAATHLVQLVRSWHEVAPVAEVRSIARRIVQAYPLRTADALQLAAALTVRGRQGAALDFVCSERQLAAVARLEGLTIVSAHMAQEPGVSSYEIAVRLGVIGSDSSRGHDVAARAKQAAQQAIRAKHRRRKGKGKTR